MDTELIRQFLKQRLSTRRDVEEAARAIGVSTATLYRYRGSPEKMTLETLGRLAETLGLPLDYGASFARLSPVSAEQRRLELEEAAAGNGGLRQIVSPTFTVNAQTREYTQMLLEIEYGVSRATKMNEYLQVRAERSRLYRDAAYTSYEIFSGFGYYDFFAGRGKFSSMPNSLREQQIEALLESCTWPHVNRRIYLRHMPELPIFSCHDPGSAVVRVNDVLVEFSGSSVVDDLRDTYEEFYESCAITSPSAVSEYLQDPIKFGLEWGYQND
jgi:transcriptional regulator with XRE-family HTH domain